MLIPKSIKKWIAVFRGEVAPVLILLSAMLGFWFGFTPGWYGIHVALLVVALILNVHFGIYLIFAGIGKALCFAAAPVLYHTGAWTQHHLGWLLDLLAAFPVLGITDTSRYAVAGSLLLGPAIGLVLGLLLAKSVQGFRQAWLRLEEGSEAFKKWQSKRWVGLLSRVLVGKGTADTRSVLERRPKLIRIPGVVVAVVVCALALGAASMVKGDALIGRTESSLSDANGAEVNLASLDLAILGGRVSAGGIQATDPQRPTHNRLAVDELTADVSLWQLLRGRVVMDEVKLSNVTFEGKRAAAGEVPASGGSTDQAESAEAAEATQFDLPLGDYAELESYFQNAEQVRDYLGKIREWLPSGKDEAASEPESVPEHYLEYLSAAARRPPTPRLLIRKLVLDDVDLSIDELGMSRIECRNLSDAPSGVSDPVVIGIESKQRKASVKLSCDYGRGGGAATADASFEDVDLAELQKKMKGNNPISFRGGTASAKISGTLTRETIDLAIAVTLKDMKADASGGVCGLDSQVTSEAMKVLSNLETTIRLVGPTESPRLVFDSSALGASLRDALVAAGKAELARRADELLQGKLSGDVPGLEGGLKTPSLEGGKDALGGLLGDEKKDDPDKEATEKDKGEDVKSQAEDALGGLFGGKKKDKKDD